LLRVFSAAEKGNLRARPGESRAVRLQQMAACGHFSPRGFREGFSGRERRVRAGLIDVMRLQAQEIGYLDSRTQGRSTMTRRGLDHEFVIEAL
jgi:hypothetical protein